MYSPNCGITNLKLSWGHDEYLYHVLKHNKSTLPDKALYIIVRKFFFLQIFHVLNFLFLFSQTEIPFILSLAYIPRLYTFRSTRRRGNNEMGQYIQVSLEHRDHIFYLHKTWILADSFEQQQKIFFFYFYSRYDLYTKSAKVPNIEELWPYYQTLIDKYCPGDLEF